MTIPDGPKRDRVVLMYDLVQPVVYRVAQSTGPSTQHERLAEQACEGCPLRARFRGGTRFRGRFSLAACYVLLYYVLYQAAPAGFGLASTSRAEIAERLNDMERDCLHCGRASTARGRGGRLGLVAP